MSRTARRVRLVAAVVAGLGSAFATGHVPASAASAVAVDGGTVFQRIDGFGISEAFGQANSIRNADRASGGSPLSVSAYRNTDGSVIVVVLNTGTNSAPATATVANAGLSSGTVTPFLTNVSSSTAAQPAIALAGGAFGATVPARSLVTYRITH
jgi:O-glycosyl hydrolase